MKKLKCNIKKKINFIFKIFQSENVKSSIIAEKLNLKTILCFSLTCGLVEVHSAYVYFKKTLKTNKILIIKITNLICLWISNIKMILKFTVQLLNCSFLKRSV